jgi:hypothetical protein
MVEKKGGFSDKLRLRERAEEDIYFARRDRERIEALHEGESAEQRPDKVDQDREKNVAPDVADQKPHTFRGVIEYCRRLVRKLLGSTKQ